MVAATGESIAAWWWAVVLSAAMIAATVTDLRRGMIYNWITYPAIAIGLIGHTLLDGWSGLAGAGAGLAMGYLPMLAIQMSGGIGGGDAKLAGAVGALAGWEFVLAAMLAAFVLAGVLAVIVMIRLGIVRRTLKRVWRSVVLAVVPGGKGRTEGEYDSPKLPFGVAMAAGALLVLIARIVEATSGVDLLRL